MNPKVESTRFNSEIKNKNGEQQNSFHLDIWVKI